MGARASSCMESLSGRRQLPDMASSGKVEEVAKRQHESVEAILGSRSIKCPVPFVTAEHIKVAESFEALHGDVIIVTYPKCGTTWCQQLCHQLRTGGHTDFEEISEERIVPWIEVSPALGIDVSLPQIAEPRCFKTHQMLSALSRFEKPGARFLCVLRDPEATLLSNFKFLLSRGTIEDKDVNTFAAKFLPCDDVRSRWGGSLWDFYAEFWCCRMLPNVLLLVFEELKADLEKHVLAIADFMQLPEPNAESRATVLELGSFAWMQKNDHLFDDHHVGQRLRKVKGKGKGEGKGNGDGEGDKFVKASKVGLEVGDDVNVKVTEETRALLRKAWQEIMQPITGHATYKDMIEDLRHA